MRRELVWLLALAVVTAPTAEPRNVLLIVLDDAGVDVLGCYGESSAAGPTPIIDAFAADGVLFRQAYAMPTCSPTRASLLTGQLPFRHGVGYPIGSSSTAVLGPGRTLLPMALRRAGAPHALAHIGKWHVSTPLDSPNTFGYDRFAGRIEGDMPDYFNWTKVTDGVESQCTTYAITENINDALAWVSARSGPWLLSLNANAPHIPLHLPPNDLHGYDHLPNTRADRRNNPLPYHQAMLEAFDTELGRLWGGIPAGVRENTTVIIIGDNGTWGEGVIQAPFIGDRSKGTLYQGGVRVPLIIAGAGVAAPGRETSALASVVDLYATIWDLCGCGDGGTIAPGAAVDARSLMPLLADPAAAPVRTEIVAEGFGGPDPTLDARAILSNGYKLLRFADGREELYHIPSDPFEQINLLSTPLDAAEQAALDSLRARDAELDAERLVVLDAIPGHTWVVLAPLEGTASGTPDADVQHVLVPQTQELRVQPLAVAAQ